MSRSTFTTALTAGLVATMVIGSRPGWAADGDNIDDVRQELRQLRAQLQALRSVIAEYTEYDRQRASFLARALKALGGTVAPPTAPARGEAAVAMRTEGPDPAPATAPAPPRRRTEA